MGALLGDTTGVAVTGLIGGTRVPAGAGLHESAQSGTELTPAAGW